MRIRRLLLGLPLSMGACDAVPPPTPSPPTVLRGLALCSPWTQNCPSGEKCTSMVDPALGTDTTGCVAVARTPGRPGDACTNETDGTDGVDTCERGAVCWTHELLAREGSCVAQCKGNESNPICVDPRTSCVVSKGGTSTLCLPHCDPLAQDCSGASVCQHDGEVFVCVPEDAAGTAELHEACDATTTCAPGLSCVDTAARFGCAGPLCCAQSCDLRGGACPRGQACAPLYPEPDAPPGDEHLGVCRVDE